MDDSLLGVGAVGLVVGLVEGAKQLGLPTRYAPALAAALGLLLKLGYAWSTGAQDRQSWYGAVLTGLALGLAAAGLYDVPKQLAPQALRVAFRRRGGAR